MPVTGECECCLCGARVTAQGLSKEAAKEEARAKLWNHWMDKHKGGSGT